MMILNKKITGGGRFFYHIKICVISSSLIFSQSLSAADDLVFDSSFLKVGDKTSVDLTRFTLGAYVPSGFYKLDIYVNSTMISTEDILIKSFGDEPNFPCLKANVVNNLNLDYARIPTNVLAEINSGQCVDLTNGIPDAKVTFDSNLSRIDIQIPQLYLKSQARGTVDAKLWDKGIPAVLFQYNANAYNSEVANNHYQSAYASLSTGINIDAWYIRQNGGLNWSKDQGADYTSINAYAQRSLPEWQGILTLGQTFTRGEVFDSLPLTGIQFNTDDNMLPVSQQGYAPEIRGIAKTNARVTVRQGGIVIYETTVSPGEFLINDLNPTGYGGNLEVKVLEADGTAQYFSVPYAAVAQLLRPDSQRFSVAMGEYRDDSLLFDPAFFQVTYQRGISNWFTGYAGAQASEDYYAFQAGAAINSYIGSFSADMTQARTRLLGSYEDRRGQSFQLRYNKNFLSTGSNFAIAAFRFSTDGFMDFATAMRARNSILRTGELSDIYQTKNRLTISANQSLPDDLGHFYINGVFEQYWDNTSPSRQYQFGYSNRFGSLYWGINASRVQDANGLSQNNYALNFSIPLGGTNSRHYTQLSGVLSKDGNGNERQQASLSGALGDNRQLSYALNANHGNQGIGTSADVNLGYVSQVSSLTANYSAGQQYQSQGFGMSGSMVAHSGGVTVSPYIGDTYALVEAKGAEGAAISGYSGIKVDSNGYALVPSLMPYRENTVTIDPNGISNQVELTSTMDKVVPYSNAVVLAKFDTKEGVALLINGSFNDKPLPFGASVLDEQGQIIGIVGQAGQIYARVEHKKGSLTVALTGTEQCRVRYDLSAEDITSMNIKKLNSVCKIKN
ncbi:fimbria/pilus outer membrane usher protein [Shewanella mangrovisoli]|uniref:fimbria/pilus outer membrane usher protein n=1 Tax=Shewanella mangrovisoli TaxID=2864211 RepID=UPI0035B8F9FE